MCDKCHCYEYRKEPEFAQLAEAHVVARLLIAITACAVLRMRPDVDYHRKALSFGLGFCFWSMVRWDQPTICVVGIRPMPLGINISNNER